MKREPNLLITFVLSCFLTLGCIGQPPPATTPATTPPSEPITYQNPQPYRVVFIVTVYNRGFDVDNLIVYQARPIEWDSQRNVHIEKVSPSAEQRSDPVYGNGIYYWEVVNEPSQGESLPFIIQFTFTAYETITDINPDDVQPYNKGDPDYELYTQPEKFIESDDPQIAAVADEIAAGETNPYLLARKFYHYVIDTAEYEGLRKGLRGAKVLLTTGKGECGDYSALFVALCRTKGIPARPVVGYWAYSGLDQVHVWAEFHIEPFGWIPVDPNIGQFQPGNREYYFGSMDNERVILHKGYNIPLDPPAPNNTTAELLQAPYWWFWGRGNPDTLRMEPTSWTVTTLSTSQKPLLFLSLFFSQDLLRVSRCS